MSSKPDRSLSAAGRLLLVGLVSACSAPSSRMEAGTESRPCNGTLLIVGGGLDDDSRPIYERFVALASAHGPANIVIATAATGTQGDEVVDKTEALRVWAPGVPVRAILRETSTAETVAAIDAATAMLFTGGDQARITARYRPDDHDTPEWLAMRRLLERGGVIAGCSAGDAMMGEVMMLSGGSAAALGIGPNRDDAATAKSANDTASTAGSATPGAATDDEPTKLGPQVGPGMRFLPWAMTDSHFFERDRVGRLVAALETSGRRLGIAVSEDGAVEVDLARGDVRGVGVSEALLVDVVHLSRDGLTRTNVLARVIEQGDRVSLIDRLASRPPVPKPMAGTVHDVPVVEPGQNRQLASWRLFRCAAQRDGTPQRLRLGGWRVTAWPAGGGDVAFEVGPR